MSVYRVKSPIPDGPDGTPAFRLLRLAAREEMNRPFQYTIDLFSGQPAIDPDDMLGNSMTITMIDEDTNLERHFNGLVSRFWNLGLASGGYCQYRVELRPWFYFLHRTANCRIFQTSTVLDIFEKVCRDTHGFSDFRNSLSESYTTWDYRVQYRESDFHFLSRLLEEEGVFYFFEHEKEKHTMILGDGYGAYLPIDGGPRIPYRLPGESKVELEHISRWHSLLEMQTGTYVLDDFDFTKPSANLESGATLARHHRHADFEVFDYPGRFCETADGDRFAKIRIEELQSQYHRFNGDSDHRGMSPGRLFELSDFSRTEENTEYVLFSTQVSLETGDMEAVRTENKDDFQVQFVAIPNPSGDVFRPERRTPKPVVYGPQTAIVVGKQNEEIWTDQYGRVKLQFHWDREGQSNEESSCWVRVSQLWAGKSWGGIQIPRIGQEVVVDFLEGDPDRPIVTGRVYNDEQMPPYALPDKQSQSGVISRSTKDGNAESFNELRFEDKKGEEQIYFHAERDFERVVENNDKLKVGFDTKKDGDQTIEIFNNQVIKIGGSSAPDGSQVLEVWKNRSAKVQSGDDTTLVSQGNHSLTITAGKSEVSAGQSITLKVGASSIVIDMSSITIKAPNIIIEGQASLDAKGGATTNIEGAMTTVKGSGMMTVQGALVKIN